MLTFALNRKLDNELGMAGRPPLRYESPVEWRTRLLGSGSNALGLINREEAMNTLADFLAKFGSIINLAAIITLFGYVMKATKATIDAKEAQIKLLEGHLTAVRENTIEKVRDRFQAMKQFYEDGLSKLSEAEQLQLTGQYEKQISARETQHRGELDTALDQLKEMEQRYRALGERHFAMRFEQVQPDLSKVFGRYAITGHNPSADGEGLGQAYSGELGVRPDANMVQLEYTIDGSRRQKFVGTGICCRTPDRSLC